MAGKVINRPSPGAGAAAAGKFNTKGSPASNANAQITSSLKGKGIAKADIVFKAYFDVVSDMTFKYNEIQSPDFVENGSDNYIDDSGENSYEDSSSWMEKKQKSVVERFSFPLEIISDENGNFFCRWRKQIPKPRKKILNKLTTPSHIDAFNEYNVFYKAYETLSDYIIPIVNCWCKHQIEYLRSYSNGDTEAILDRKLCNQKNLQDFLTELFQGTLPLNIVQEIIGKDKPLRDYPVILPDGKTWIIADIADDGKQSKTNVFPPSPMALKWLWNKFISENTNVRNKAKVISQYALEMLKKRDLWRNTADELWEIYFTKDDKFAQWADPERISE